VLQQTGRVEADIVFRRDLFSLGFEFLKRFTRYNSVEDRCLQPVLSVVSSGITSWVPTLKKSGFLTAHITSGHGLTIISYAIKAEN
jgi:hypothetical protein